MKTRVWLNTPNSNYSDRKRYIINLDNYISFELYREEEINFNYGDMINTQCTSNAPLDLYAKQPNYMLLLNEEGEIESRWFVLESKFNSSRTTSGVYNASWQMALYRDITVDHREIFKDNLVRVDRGWLPNNYTNISILNTESLELNQIKKLQSNLIDFAGETTRWATFFYSKGTEETPKTEIIFDLGTETTLDYNNLQATEWGQKYPFSFNSQEINVNPNNIIYKDDKQLTFYFSNASYVWQVIIARNNIGYYRVNLRYMMEENYGFLDSDIQEYQPALRSNFSAYFNGSGKSLLDSIWNTTFITEDNKDAFNEMYNEYGREFINVNEVGGGIYYIGNDTRTSINAYKNDGVINKFLNLSSLINPLGSIYREVTGTVTGPFEFRPILNIEYTTPYLDSDGFWKCDSFEVNQLSNFGWTSGDKITSTLKGLIDIPEGTVTLPLSGPLDEINAYAITIPYNDITVDNRSISSSTVQSILTQGYTSLGSQALDVQILPYCPNTEIQKAYLDKNITSSLLGNQAIPIKNNLGKIIYHAFKVNTCSKSITIEAPEEANEWWNPTNIKQAVMSDFCRIGSPNHNSSFEFKPTSNLGITNFQIEWTLKPLKTFYRITPIWNNNGLYGGNFNDSRGLTVEGGFSLSQISSAWVEYQLQNSTYQQMFNADINNLEISNQVAKQKEILSRDLQLKQGVIATTTAGIGAAASLASTALTGPIGALAGGGSAIQAISQGLNTANQLEYNNANIAQNDILRGQAEKLKQNQFDLTNQAIQAKPNTLSRSSDFNINTTNKFYIECFTCTDVEKASISNYLYYQGMSIQRTDLLKEYHNKEAASFVKGSLIFAPGLTTHETNALAEEFYLGFFIEPNFTE